MMAAALPVLLLLCSPAVHCFVTQGAGAKGCSFDVSEDLPDPSPLVLRDGPPFPSPSATPGFRYPDDGPELRLQEGEAVRLSCGAGSTFLIDGESKAVKASADIRAECIGHQVVRVPSLGLQLPLNRLACERYVNSVAIINGTCPLPRYDATPKPKLIQVGFPLEEGYLRTLEICFDQANLDAIYSRSTISPKIVGHQTHVARPPFMAGPLYNGTDVNTLYKRRTQRQTLARLLRSTEMAEFFIRMKGDLFLSRGHLVPKADLVYAPAQRSTFHFENAAPQWQAFNRGNWERVEAAVRDLAVSHGLELQVTTGTHGVTTLPDVDGVQQALYLLVDGGRRGVRVPHYFWKVVHHPATGAGVVLVGINNPYHVVTQDDVFCEDVCDDLTWLNLPNRKSQVAGYVFCCEVDSFRNIVATLPPIKVSSLLI